MLCSLFGISLFIFASCGTPCKVCDGKGRLQSGMKCDYCQGDGTMSEKDKERVRDLTN